LQINYLEFFISICIYLFNMKRISLVLLSYLIYINYGYCQKRQHNIDSLISIADSVVIKSHIDIIIPSHYIPNDSSTRFGKYIPGFKRQIFENNDLIDSFTIQKQLLSIKSKNRLIHILTTYSTEEYTTANCFDPHQSIIFYLKTGTEYLDLCFGCQRVRFSNGIRFTNQTFSSNQWQALEKFFISLKVDHKIRGRIHF